LIKLDHAYTLIFTYDIKISEDCLSVMITCK